MHQKKIHILLVILYALFSETLSAQTTQIESLRKRLISERNTESEIRLTLLLCDQYHSLPADSLQKYIKRGVSLAGPNSTAAFRFNNYYCFYLFKTGNAAQAFVYADSLLRSAAAMHIDEIVQLDIQANKAAALIRNNRHKEGINETLILLEQADKLKDTLLVLKAYTLLGWAGMELENEREAVTWLQKGLQYPRQFSHFPQASSVLNNLASCYNNLGNMDSALFFISQGMAYSKASENLANEANALNIRADIFLKTNKKAEAEADLKNALYLREQIGDLHYVVSDMGQLAYFYATILEPGKGISIAKKGIGLAAASSNLSKLIFLHSALAENYKVAQRQDEYAKTLLKIIELKDSLYQPHSDGVIAEMVTRYELEKKEHIIVSQENKIIKNNYFYLGSVAVFILLLIFIWVLYRNYTHVQRRKMENALAEERIQSVKAIQDAEEKERKRIAADLHDNLGSYAAAITANIGYLKEGVNPENENIISQLDENAKAIVTQLSDSIWVLKNEQLPVTKLADRFKAWVQRIMQNFPDINYHYDEHITNDIEFTPYNALNIFLILKECLNNALKHSGCTEIRISFVSTGLLQLSVEDNGNGFVRNINQGNGIENMKHRAAESHLQIEWITLTPSGTRVEISNTTN